MMKKGYILVLMLLFLPIVYGSEIFSGDVEDQESWEAGGHTFKADYNIGNAKLLFEIDNLREILEVAECAYRDNIKVCFDDVELDVTDTVESITVSIYDITPSIEITRTFSDTSLLLGDDTEVTVTLTNDGDAVATNVVYTDSYPSSIEVRSFDSNSAIWAGSISSGESESFKYKLRAKSVIEYESVATVSHVYDGKKITDESDSETIEVKAPYELDIELNKERAKRNELVLLNITFENKDDTDDLIIHDLEIKQSYLVKVNEFSDGFSEAEGVYTYSGIINEDDSESFMVKLYSGRNAEHYIDISYDFKIGNIIVKDNIKKEFEVGLSSVYAVINVTPEKVLAGDSLAVKVQLKNDGETSVTGADVKIESDLFDVVESNDNTVAAGGLKSILDNKPNVPEVESETTYNIKVTGSYVEDGETYSFENNKEVVIVPTPKIVSMSHQLEKEEFEVGDLVNVVVFIENLDDSSLDKVSLIEMLPNEVKNSLEGDILIDTPLEKGENKEAYSYSFTIPSDFQKETIDLRTIVNVKKGESLYKYDWSKQIKITGIKDIEEEISNNEVEESVDITDNETTEDIQEEKKEGFFKRIINLIKNIFSRSPPEEQE